MDLYAIISAAATAMVTGSGAVVILSKVASRYVGKRLEQVEINSERLTKVEGAIVSFGKGLDEVKATTLRIEGQVGMVQSDVAYLKGRFGCVLEREKG